MPRSKTVPIHISKRTHKRYTMTDSPKSVSTSSSPPPAPISKRTLFPQDTLYDLQVTADLEDLIPLARLLAASPTLSEVAPDAECLDLFKQVDPITYRSEGYHHSAIGKLEFYLRSFPESRAVFFINELLLSMGFTEDTKLDYELAGGSVCYWSWEK